MKQVFLIMTFVIAALTVNAQDYDYYNDYHYYDGIEYNNSYGITSDQRSRIIAIKKNAGYRFAAIGKDRSLSGREKGERKRALSMQIRREINDILNENQRRDWDNRVSSSNSSSSSSYANSTGYTNSASLTDIENRIRAIEYQIKKEEREYDRRADEIDDNYLLPKEERKAQKRKLKNEWKYRKQELKDEKQRLKDLI